MKDFIRSEKAVSEAIGFVLTFGIVILATAVVFVAGTPLLDRTERAMHFQEMEQSFFLLSQNIDKVGFDRAPVRNTEMKIKGGSLSILQGSSKITVNDTTYTLGSVEYSYEDKIIAYEDGGIWTKYPGGNVIMVSKPAFSVGNVTTIPAIELLGDDSIGGEGIVRISASGYTSSINNVIPVNGNISIEIKSSYYKGWANYLAEIGATNITTDDANSSVSSIITTKAVNVDSNQLQIKIL